MQRTVVLAATAGAVALGAILGVYLIDALAQETTDPPAAVIADAGERGVKKADATVKQTQGQQQVPVSQVVLFSSGVGYFQREGEVDGNARIDLIFQQENINDLLKSMTLQDLGGGRVSTVSYDSRDPIEKTLKSYAINLTGNPSFSQILTQARGEKVEVLMTQTNVTQPGTVSGTIVGVEKQKMPVGKEGAVECEMLNLLCADGMRCLKLMDVQKVRFLNPIIESELKRALDTLALSHDVAKKSVSIHFEGDGKRNVRVGYVTEAPIWKTSYRLVLGKDGKPFLQGWAVVENTTDEDWKDVRMALISGRPISFQMNLYDPLYVARPVVEPELFASLRPVTYGGAMDRNRDTGGGPMPPPAPGTAGSPAKDSKAADGFNRQQEQLRELERRRANDLKKALEEKMDLESGVASVAQAGNLGDFFQYVIDHPVSLPRQKSALLPIINQPVEGTRVSIYNEKTLAKHPLLGLKFKNTSGAHLMQGPITVFEGSNYAGDARILDMQKNEERLISYAVDLGTEVEAIVPSKVPDRLTKLKVHKGIVYTTTRVVDKKVYNVKNRSDSDRRVVLEHPFRPEFTLKAPEKYAERSRDFYRFELLVEAGQEAKQEVVEERDVVTTVQLTNQSDDQIRYFIQTPVTSEAVRRALEQALELKSKMDAARREVVQVERDLKILLDDQARIRQNLDRVPPTSAAYKRYLEKLDAQEPEIEALQAKIRKFQEDEHKHRIAYENYLGSLDVE